MKEFINILQMKEYKLHNFIIGLLKTYDYTVYETEDYIYADYNKTEEEPICLITHLDIVWMLPPIEDDIIYDENKDIMINIGDEGLGADDRAGVYIVLTLLKKGHRPKGLIFTHNEECGGVGAYQLINAFPKPISTYNYLIQLDRQGLNDCVFYQCDNKSFENYINSFGWQTRIGTMSDISIIAPAWGIAAVNLSTGYFNEHTLDEIVKPKYIQNEIIPKVEQMLKCSCQIGQFKYLKSSYKNYPISRSLKINHNNPEFIDNTECYYCGKDLNEKTKMFVSCSDKLFYICPICKKKHHPPINF